MVDVDAAGLHWYSLFIGICFIIFSFFYVINYLKHHFVYNCKSIMPRAVMGSWNGNFFYRSHRPTVSWLGKYDCPNIRRKRRLTQSASFLCDTTPVFYALKLPTTKPQLSPALPHQQPQSFSITKQTAESTTQWNPRRSSGIPHSTRQVFWTWESTGGTGIIATSRMMRGCTWDDPSQPIEKCWLC